MTALDLGLHLLVGLHGTALLEEERELLERLRPAGIILFGKNIARDSADWIAELEALITAARRAIGRKSLFVSIDHEGGRVFRFLEPVTRFPPAKDWRDRAPLVAQAMARELASLGFNLSFAPVLDIHSEASNPVIGVRALGTDPEAVASSAALFYDALEAEGILGCGKHFPGHGATVSDSHFVLPRLGATEELLRERELVPFMRLIRHGMGMVMTAHVVYPAFDPQYPATLSSTIIDGVLRGELGFDGVVITDDLEMKALESFSPGEKAQLALGAGNDILLEANPSERPALRVAEEMLEGIRLGLQAGTLSEERLLRSEARIRELLDKCERLAPCREAALGDRSLLGCQPHRELMAALERRD